MFSKVAAFAASEDDQEIDIALAVEHRLLRGHPRLRERDLHHRGRHARRGLQDRPHLGVQQVRQGSQPAQGEGGEPPGRGHPRGSHRHHLGQAEGSSVRGPDQGQARQRLHSIVGAAGHQREAGRVVRGEPDGGQPRRQEGHGRGAGPGGGQERSQRHPSQDSALGRRHAGQAEGLLQPRPTRERAVHRRG